MDFTHKLQLSYICDSGGGRKRSGRPKKVQKPAGPDMTVTETKQDPPKLADKETDPTVAKENKAQEVVQPKQKNIDSLQGPRERSWISLFKDLLWYKDRYGDTMVPQKFPGIPDLGPWTVSQRKQYKEINGKTSEVDPNEGTTATALASDIDSNEPSIAENGPSTNKEHTLTAECMRLLNSIGFDWDWVEPDNYKPAREVDIQYKGKSFNTREIVINEGIPIKQVVPVEKEDKTPKRKRGRPKKPKHVPEGDIGSVSDDDKTESDAEEKNEEKSNSKKRKNTKKKEKMSAKRALPTRKSARKKSNGDNATLSEAYGLEKPNKKKKGKESDLEVAAAALFSLSSNCP